MKKIVVFIVAFTIGGLATASYCSIAGCKEALYSQIVTSYEECKEQGFAIIEGDPPRCMVDEDTVFVQDPVNITVNDPQIGAMVSNPFTVKGTALAVNNEVFYALTNTSGNTLASGSTTTNSSEHGIEGDFSVTMAFEQSEQPTGLNLSLFSQLPNGTREDEIIIPLQYGEVANEPDVSLSREDFSAFSEISNEQSAQSISFDPLASITVPDRPNSVSLDVPFTSQAPFENWDHPFNEACEEASLIMVKYYIDNKNLSKAAANGDIIEIVQWQENNGFAVDVSTDELVTIAREYYSMNAKTYKGDQVSIENIEALLANDYPVIIPAAGRMLGNQYFSGAGPPYHMLVITGYDNNYFYTNDPGTKRGEEYRYTKDVIMNAIHDWNGSIDTITSGPKSMLILEP